MKVDYSKYPEIPPGCQLNLNRNTGSFQVFREFRERNEETGRMQTRRESIGQIGKDGVFTFSKLWKALEDNKRLSARIRALEDDLAAAQTKKERQAAQVCERFDRRVRRNESGGSEPGEAVYPMQTIVFGALMCALMGSFSSRAVSGFVNENAELLRSCGVIVPEQAVTDDIVCRALLKIEPARFDAFCHQVISTINVVRTGRLRAIAADGQAVRSRGCRSADDPQLRSAWMLLNIFDGAGRISLTHKLTEEKTKKINVVPELTEMFDIRGAVVAADAMSCQLKFIEAVLGRGADYCLAARENQLATLGELRSLFASVPSEQFSSDETGWDLAHGRVEKRTVRVIKGALTSKLLQDKWPQLSTGAVVEAISVVTEKASGNSSGSRRYYISSLPASDSAASDFQTIIRMHWRIEDHLPPHLAINFLHERSSAPTPEFVANRPALCMLASAMLEKYRYWLWDTRQTEDLLSIEAVMQRCRAPAQAIECLACACGYI